MRRIYPTHWRKLQLKCGRHARPIAKEKALPMMPSRRPKAPQAISDRQQSGPSEKKKALLVSQQGFSFRSLAVTYSGMPEGHTTIGAERFHFRVRNGIGWFPLAMAARQTV
jgi:hypothetical protein